MSDIWFGLSMAIFVALLVLLVWCLLQLAAEGLGYLRDWWRRRAK